MERRIRILIAKCGLDGHDRGAKTVAMALVDAGMEVIYTGLHRTPEEVVQSAIQEGVDGIGLSVLSGAHLTIFHRVIQLLKENEVETIAVFGGGSIPKQDIVTLEQMGTKRIFTPGSSLSEIVGFVKTMAPCSPTIS